MNTKDFTHAKWLICAGICIALAIFLLLGSHTFLKNAPNVETNTSTSNNVYLSFSANYASVGTPLSVHLYGADDSDAKYKWTVGNVETSHTGPTYTPTEDDLEKFITVTVTYDLTETVSATLYCSKLPVLYINTDEVIGEDYVAGTFSSQGSSEYTPQNTEFYFGDVYLKLRGNSTKYRAKAPYKLKLGESSDLYNMGSSKHWVLLANDIDHTFIRNKLVYDFSAAIGADYATESVNVALVLNNEYQGVYQLCEQIRVSDERVDIYDWEQLAKNAAALIAQTKAETEGLSSAATKEFTSNLEYELCTDLSWISSPYEFTYEGTTYKITDYIDISDVTGGFILEMDFYNANNPNGLKTNYEQPFYFNSPEYGYTSNELYSYAYKYIQSFEYALHSEDHTFHNYSGHYKLDRGWYDPANGWIYNEDSTFYSDPANDGKHYTELFDMNSLIVNFFVCEFSMNWDSMKNSVFVTKDIDELAMLSPCWDFDWAFGNDNMYRIDTDYPTSWHTTNDYFTNEQLYQAVQWNRYLIRDPYFLYLAYEKYKEIRPTVIEDIIKENGLIDSYYSLLYEAGLANDNLWSSTYREYGGKNYEESMKNLKEFITTRIAWMDKQFESFDTFVNSLGYYNASEDVYTTATYNNDGTVTLEGHCSGEDITYILFQINGTTTYKVFAGTDGYARTTIDAGILNEKDTNVIEIHGLDSYENFIDDCHNYNIF